MIDREAYRGRRALVTGGRGFIGRRVAAALHAAGAEVVAVLRPGDDAPAVDGLEIVHADLSEPGVGTRLVAGLAPEITFNLAGYGVDPAERESTSARRLNTDLVAELADGCAASAHGDWSGQRLVHVGSALEYGAARGDLAESTAPSPTTLYGSTKLAGTAAVERAIIERGLRGGTARLFTVYGPGEHPGRLLPSLLRAAREGSVLELTAGDQRRDFTWLDDVVEGLLRLGALPGEPFGTVNLATGRLTAVRDFVERAAGVLGLDRGQLRFGALATRAEEMAHGDVNVGRLVALTGWRPATPIEEGVRRTAAEA